MTDRFWGDEPHLSAVGPTPASPAASGSVRYGGVDLLLGVESAYAFSRARTEEVLRALVHEIRAERLTFMAGSIAYHAFLSILPLYRWC